MKIKMISYPVTISGKFDLEISGADFLDNAWIEKKIEDILMENIPNILKQLMEMEIKKLKV